MGVFDPEAMVSVGSVGEKRSTGYSAVLVAFSLKLYTLIFPFITPVCYEPVSLHQSPVCVAANKFFLH